jgi:hypothetical protein
LLIPTQACILLAQPIDLCLKHTDLTLRHGLGCGADLGIAKLCLSFRACELLTKACDLCQNLGKRLLEGFDVDRSMACAMSARFRQWSWIAKKSGLDEITHTRGLPLCVVVNESRIRLKIRALSTS